MIPIPDKSKEFCFQTFYKQPNRYKYALKVNLTNHIVFKVSKKPSILFNLLFVL